MSNIVDVAGVDKNLATTSKDVKAAGMETEVVKQDTFTVFAPSEMAFGRLASGVLNNWMKPENIKELTSILSYHIVEGKNK